MYCEFYFLFERRSIITVIMNTVPEKKEHVIIFAASLARQLLKMGYQIIDIKPDRNDPTGKSIIFIFKNEGNFEDDFHDLIRQRVREQNTAPIII